MPCAGEMSIIPSADQAVLPIAAVLVAMPPPAQGPQSTLYARRPRARRWWATPSMKALAAAYAP